MWPCCRGTLKVWRKVAGCGTVSSFASHPRTHPYPHPCTHLTPLAIHTPSFSHQKPYLCSKSTTLSLPCRLPLDAKRTRPVLHSPSPPVLQLQVAAGVVRACYCSLRCTLAVVQWCANRGLPHSCPIIPSASLRRPSASPAPPAARTLCFLGLHLPFPSPLTSCFFPPPPSRHLTTSSNINVTIQPFAITIVISPLIDCPGA